MTDASLQARTGAAVIGVVACCAKKLDRPAPARELYVSPLFRMSLAYAESRCDAVYIASALHGVVMPDQVLKPYEFKMSERSKKERETWGDRFADQLIGRHGRAFDVLMLAGVDYAWPIGRRLHTAFGHRDDGWKGVDGRILEPMSGMQIGQRLKWLKAELAPARQIP